MLKPHECGDTRLKCIECDGPVCPKCMVQCPVGQRCKGCSGKFTSHVLNVGFGQLAIMFVVALVLGGAFGFAGGIFGGGLWMWVLVYFLGVAAGNLIHKVVGFKIGPKVIATASVAILAGGATAMHFSPLNMAHHYVEPMVNQSGQLAHEYMTSAWKRWMDKDSKRDQNSLNVMKENAQKGLPELASAIARKSNCQVLVETDPSSTIERYDWLSAQSMAGGSVLCDLGETERSFKTSEIVDWLYFDNLKAFKSANAVLTPSVQLASLEKEVAQSMAMLEAYSYIDLLVFLGGVVTILSGQAPALRFPFFRR